MRFGTKVGRLLLPLAAALLLAACSTSEDLPPAVELPEDPQFTPSQVVASVEQTVDGVERAAMTFATSELFDILPGGSAVTSFDTLSGSFSLLADPELTELPRGVIDLDDPAAEPEPLDDGVLYKWGYLDSKGDEKAASLDVKWLSTYEQDFGSYRSELPEHATFQLTADGRDFGQGEFGIAYGTADECGNFTIPESLTFDGYVGPAADRLTAALQFGFERGEEAAALSTTGEVSLDSGGHSAALDWDVLVSGEQLKFEDEWDCWVEFRPGSIDAEVGVGTYGLELRGALALELGYDDDTGGLNSISVDASLSINDFMAVSIAGTATEADDDDPFENIVFEFGNGEELTLAELSDMLSSRYSFMIYSALNALH